MMTSMYKFDHSPGGSGLSTLGWVGSELKLDRAGSVSDPPTKDCENAMVNQVARNSRGQNPALDDVADPLLIEFPLSSPASIKTSRGVLRSPVSIADPLSTNPTPTTKIVLAKEDSESIVGNRSKFETDRLTDKSHVRNLTIGMVHDFNNLLTVVSGSLAIIQKRARKAVDRDVERHVLTAQDAVQRAAAVSRRLLCYSRKVADKVEVLDVSSFVSGMDEIIRRAVGPGIVVVFDLSTDKLFVAVSPSQLESSLLNLCINAKDAMPGGGTIVIQISDQLLALQVAHDFGISPGRYVSLRVSDNGSGMEEDDVSRAFEPFFSTKPVGAGTGLGLPMVKHFADHASGVVNIVSRMGQGTDVTVYLPVNPAPSLEAIQT